MELVNLLDLSSIHTHFPSMPYTLISMGGWLCSLYHQAVESVRLRVQISEYMCSKGVISKILNIYKHKPKTYHFHAAQSCLGVQVMTKRDKL